MSFADALASHDLNLASTNQELLKTFFPLFLLDMELNYSF